MATTKIYKNTGTLNLNVVGIGEIPAGEQVSMTTDYHPPVVLINYPGLVEITDEAPAQTAEPSAELDNSQKGTTL